MAQTAPINILVKNLHPFQGHPFKVLDDEEMSKLIQSIQTLGILTPLIVRPKDNTVEEYEIISGHRRFHAAVKVGIKEVPAFVVQMNKYAAAIVLVDSNLHREHILPSEKAYAYKLKMEAISHQGISCQFGTKLRSDEQIAKTVNDSARQIQRYIRLTNLIKPILTMVDESKIAFTPAVELSYLTEIEQQLLLAEIDYTDSTPSLSQAIRLKKLSHMGKLNEESINSIMSEEKANQIERIRIPTERVRKFFPKNYTISQMEEEIVKMCKVNYQKKIKSRNEH